MPPRSRVVTRFKRAEQLQVLKMHHQAIMSETPTSQENTIDELFAQHYRASLRTARRILRSKEDCEDAVQTAYCAAFRHFHGFRGESSFNTWITRIVVNCCLMQLRERRARPQLALDDTIHAPESCSATPEALCYWAELRAAHTRATSRLPKVLHDVYADSMISGIALPKVADELGLTMTAAKSRLFRARKRVERSLQPVFQRRVA